MFSDRTTEHGATAFRLAELESEGPEELLHYNQLHEQGLRSLHRARSRLVTAHVKLCKFCKVETYSIFYKI